MKIWLPYTQGGSGTDVFTETLAAALNRKGVVATTSRFAHNYQYAPWFLMRTHAPDDTDIVLANTWNAFVFKRPGTKLVAVEHLLVLDPALAPFRTGAQAFFHSLFVRYFETASQRNSDKIVAVSEYTRDMYAAALNKEPPVVIPNGIDTDFFCPMESALEDSSERPFRLLFVGNISRRKGADMLPEIMERLGQGYELSYTVGLRVKDPFPSLNNVRRLGRLDHEGVRREYQRADVLVFPTRLEGLPLVAMEAMACGTPVVASNTASLPEVVRHGETGLLCRLNDCHSFAKSIQFLRDHPDVFREMQVSAINDAQSRFSLDRMADSYIGLFSSLLE